jgi:hypothetical protein
VAPRSSASIVRPEIALNPPGDRALERLQRGGLERGRPGGECECAIGNGAPRGPKRHDTRGPRAGQPV